jgi:serine/threonine protein phosphatase PrpC
MTSADQYLIVASDGVWEFLTNKQVVEISRAADDPQDAAQMLWKVRARC